MFEEETGKMLEYRQLMRHPNPKIKQTWTRSAADEFGRLFQGVGKGQENGQRIKGTNTFFLCTSIKSPNINSKISHVLEQHAPSER